MDRQFIAGLASIVLVVLVVSWNVADRQSVMMQEDTLGGNAFATAIANGAAVTNTPLPFDVSVQANAGSVPSYTTVVPRNGVLRYSVDGIPTASSGISIELVGSETARSADFFVQHGDSAEGGSSEAIPLAATQSEEGVWYSFVSADQFSLLYDRFGPGWYVFTASATRGEDSSGFQQMAFFVP